MDGDTLVYVFETNYGHIGAFTLSGDVIKITQIVNFYYPEAVLKSINPIDKYIRLLITNTIEICPQFLRIHLLDGTE